MSADWSSVPAPVPYANLTNPQTLNLYAMVSDNPETFADLDGHEGVGAEGAAESSDEMEESGEPADCARLLGCAEYLVEYADGPLDTSQAQNNADARDDASLDGVQQEQEEKPETTKETAKEDAEVEKLLEQAGAAITQRQGESRDAFLRRLQENGGDDPITGACYAPTKSEPSMGPLNRTPTDQKADPAGGGRGAGKDRTLQGSQDRLDDLEHHQESQQKKGGYRISQERTKQDIKNSLKKIKSQSDSEDN